MKTNIGTKQVEKKHQRFTLTSPDKNIILFLTLNTDYKLRKYLIQRRCSSTLDTYVDPYLKKVQKNYENWYSNRCKQHINPILMALHHRRE